MKERRGYVVLVLISVILSGSVLLFGIRQERINEHKFCDLLDTSLTGPAPQPADPHTDPSRARNYILYVKAQGLARSLGCQ